MSRRELLNWTTGILGVFSFLSLVGYFLALHDIWHDFASPEVWARAGQELPAWYSPWNRCPSEWGMLQAGFIFLVAFHVMVFIRALFNANQSTSS